MKKLSKWYKSDFDFLIKNFPEKSNDELSILMGKPKSTINTYGSKLGLKKSNNFLLSIKKNVGGHTYRNRCVPGDMIVESSAKYNHVRVKLDSGKWVSKARHTWICAYGPISNKIKIGFLDGNALNCNLDNLYILPLGGTAKEISGSDKKIKGLAGISRILELELEGH